MPNDRALAVLMINSMANGCEIRKAHVKLVHLNDDSPTEVA